MNIKLLAALVFSIGCTTLHAAEKIATVDFAAVYSQMPDLKTATSKLESEFKPQADQLRKEEQSLNEKISILQKKANKLNSKELARQQQDLIEQRTKLQTDVESFMKQKERRQLQERDALTNKVKLIVDKVSKNRGYDMVLDKMAVASFESKDDITQDVLKAIN